MARKWPGPGLLLSPALLCGLAGDAEPGADLGPGVAACAQALDRFGYGGVDLVSEADHEGQGLDVAVPDPAGCSPPLRMSMTATFAVAR